MTAKQVERHRAKCERVRREAVALLEWRHKRWNAAARAVAQEELANAALTLAALDTVVTVAAGGAA